MSHPAPLSDPAEIVRRRALLASPHMVPLADYCAGLRGPGREVPDLDPADGGVGAVLLLLLEKPGPKTSHARGGTGFVSFDNPDPTARASRQFADEAGIERRTRAVWNVCPWWNGTIKFGAREGRAGLEELPSFLDLLPQLRVGICVGGQARKATPLLEKRGLRVFTSAHPSGQVRAANPALWNAIPAIWKEARLALDQS